MIAGICAGVDVLDHAGILDGILSTHSSGLDVAVTEKVITSRANGYVDFAIEVAKKMDLFKDEADLRETISKYAIGWNISRISRLAKAVLELAIYEILYGEDVPVAVAISEAMTLIKKYETEETASFVNGILGAFVREEGKA